MVVRTFSPSPLCRQLLDVGHQYSRYMQQLLALIRPFDVSGEWALAGYRTCGHWLASTFEIDDGTAREWIRIAHKLYELPILASSFSDAKLSYSKVRLLSRYANTDNEADLDQIGREHKMADLDVAVAKYLNLTETDEEEERRHDESTFLSWRHDADGMTSFWGRLGPQDASTFTSAVDQQVERAQSGEYASTDAPLPRKVVKWPSLRRQRAAAIMALVTNGGTRLTTEVVLHVRGDGCTMDDGTPISENVVARSLKDAFIRALIHDAERRPINASGRQRQPTDRQKRVVKERDRRCVDCGAANLHRYHHNPPFDESRHTVVDELELRCSSCHRRLHKDGGSSS